MQKRRNPAEGNRRGLDIKAFQTNPYIAATIGNQPTIDAAEWLARRARISIETARVHCELNRFGEVRS